MPNGRLRGTARLGERLALWSACGTLGSVLGACVGVLVPDTVAPDAVLAVGGMLVLMGFYGMYGLLERRATWRLRMEEYFTAIETLFEAGQINDQERRFLRRKYLERYWKDLRA